MGFLKYYYAGVFYVLSSLHYMGLFYVRSLLHIYIYIYIYIYGSILCVAPPILHKIVPYRVSYILLWVHLVYADYSGVLLLYIRCSLIRESVDSM